MEDDASKKKPLQKTENPKLWIYTVDEDPAQTAAPTRHTTSSLMNTASAPTPDAPQRLRTAASAEGRTATPKRRTQPGSRRKSVSTLVHLYTLCFISSSLLWMPCRWLLIRERALQGGEIPPR